MADQKITQLTALTGADVADADVVPVVDVSPTATTKKMTRTEFFKNTPSIGIGTSSPAAALDVNGDIYVSDDISLNGGLASLLVFRDSTSTNGYRTRANVTDVNDFGFLLEKLDGTDIYRAGGTLSDHVWSSGSGLERMRIDSSGNVGIGTSSPSEKLSVSGNVTITGSISKGSGSFKIDHPLKPDTHYLVHSFVEGPQADNLYRGKVDLVGGQAIVNLDEAGRMTEGTFVALNGNVQCFTTNEDGWTPVRGFVEGNILTIEAQDATCTDAVSWLVIGERHDQHMRESGWTDENGRIVTEPEKSDEP